MDYAQEMLDSDEDIFYDNIRALVVVFLTFSVLLPIAYIIVAYLRDFRDTPLSKDDAVVNHFVVSVCTCTVSLSIIMYLMFPLSLLTNEVLVISPDSYYVQWLNTTLLTNLFVFVTIFSKGACILLPFCFFLLSSHSVYSGKKAITSRFFDSFIYTILSFVAFFGSLATVISSIFLWVSLSEPGINFRSVSATFPRFCFSSPMVCYWWVVGFFGDLICCIDSTLVMLQHAASYIGFAILLICMPYGVKSILMWALSSSIVHPPKVAFDDSLLLTVTETIDKIYELKKARCSSYIESLKRSHCRPRLSCNGYPTYDAWNFGNSYPQYIDLTSFTQLVDFEHVYSLPEKHVYWDNFAGSKARSIFSLCILATLFLLLTVGTVYTTMNIFVLIYGLFFPDVSKSLSLGYKEQISVGQKSASQLGCFGALMQILLVAYLVCTSLFGFYSLPMIRKYLMPQPHATTMNKLLANVTCVLLMSSAIPLHASLLGLATPSFPLYAVALTDKWCRSANEACEHPSPICSSPQVFPVLSLGSDNQGDCAALLKKPSTQNPRPPSGTSKNARDVQLSTLDTKKSTNAVIESVITQVHQRKRWDATNSDLDDIGRYRLDNASRLYSLADLLTFVYLGLEPRSTSLLMALVYNIGFLFFSYWFFKQHLNTFINLLHLQVYYTYFTRFFPNRVLLKRKSSSFVLSGLPPSSVN